MTSYKKTSQKQGDTNYYKKTENKFIVQIRHFILQYYTQLYDNIKKCRTEHKKNKPNAKNELA